MSDGLFDNETVWRMYSPKPNPWFTSDIVYEGWGIATFDKPVGTIEGKTKITVTGAGNLDIMMEYEKLSTDATIYGTGKFRFLKFIQGDLGKGNTVAIGTENINPCSQLVVETNGGVFTSSGRIYYINSLGPDTEMRFLLWEGTYKTPLQGNSKYWVLPLTNFISSFNFNLHYGPTITQHPLRLISTPVVPEMADNDQRNFALFAANRANALIVFKFGGSVGFIQPVLDYHEKEDKLQTGKEERCVTALMISEVNSELMDIGFPYDYTNLISFAVGSYVTAPWLELRDEDGNLISRKHISQPGTKYERGCAVINEAVHKGGLGHLISVANSSTEFGKPYFRVLISHLVRLRSYNRHIEDHMDLLCRTFDSLCEEFGFSTQNLAKSLPQDCRSKVEIVLRNAKEKVNELTNNSNSAIQPVLRQIESRIQNASNVDRAFGLAVLDLLNKYEIPDGAIMNKYYSLYTDHPGKSWDQTLTQYRGAVIHTGYFAREKYDTQDVLILEDHLQDILIRLALKILGYQGSYQPRVKMNLVEGKTVYWLNEDTPVTELGYRSPIY